MLITLLAITVIVAIVLWLFGALTRTAGIVCAVVALVLIVMWLAGRGF